METKIRVHATAQNRTALGIINAYLVLFPESTLDDLNKAFPPDLNKSSHADTILVNVKDAGKFKTEDGESTFGKYFLEREDEVVKLKDGTTAALLEKWAKDDFEKIIEHARQYGIEVASFEEATPFERGSFHLEYVNNYGLVDGIVQKLDEPTKPSIVERPEKTEESKEPEKPAKKKKCRWWCWLLIALLIIALILFICCFFKCCDCCKKADTDQPAVALTTPAPENNAVPQDTLTDDNLSKEAENIAKEADEAVKKMDQGEAVLAFPVTFQRGSTTLDPASYPAFDAIVKYMAENPDAKLNIIGHASPDGSDNLNLRLSKERAQSVADYLVAQKGIAADRLIVEGKGENEPISDDPEKNRRIEMKIVK